MGWAVERTTYGQVVSSGVFTSIKRYRVWALLVSNTPLWVEVLAHPMRSLGSSASSANETKLLVDFTNS